MRRAPGSSSPGFSPAVVLVVLLAIVVVGGTAYGYQQWQDDIAAATATDTTNPGASSGGGLPSAPSSDEASKDAKGGKGDDDKADPYEPPTFDVLEPTDNRPQPVVLLVGDGYADGRGASSPSNSYASLISKELGAAYVILDEDLADDELPELRPVLNITSAQLILGAEGLEPRIVAQDVLETRPVGADLGILDAPASLPDPGALVDTGWSACTGDGLGLAVAVQDPPGVAPSAATDAVLVEVKGGSSAGLWLVATAPDTGAEPAQAHRYLLPAGSSERTDAFLREVTAELGIELPPQYSYAVGTAFLPGDEEQVATQVARIEEIAAEEGLAVLGWRDVPTDPSILGATALGVMPTFRQLFVAGATQRVTGMQLERMAFCLRKRAERETDVYFPSLSSRTMAYKGMLTTDQLDNFFPDLVDERVASALAVVHSRFSTNTFPSWPLSHPFRFIAHNGEINTVMGNRNWMRAREALLSSDLIPGDLERLYPICTPGASDSASFDEVLELLHMGGRSLPHSVLMMIPEAWENHTEMDDARRSFYEFHASLMEPWDGPACVVFTDGDQIGAVLDRNGLRPSRYWVTDDGLVVLASEVGVLDLDPATVVRKGRLQPGRMFLVDTEQHRIVEDEEIKSQLASEHPYDEWLHAGLVHLDDITEREHVVHTHASVTRRQQVFGYTEEELRVLLTPMANTGAEPIGSMGTDTPIAALSDKPRLIFDYFARRWCCPSRSSPTTTWPRSVTSTVTATCPASSPTSLAVSTTSRAGERRWPRGSTRSAPRSAPRSPTVRASSCSRTGTPPPTWRRSRRCCSPQPCTTTWCARRPAPRSACSSRPATCARSTTWPSWSATALRRSTPTSRWSPSRTSRVRATTSRPTPRSRSGTSSRRWARACSR